MPFRARVERTVRSIDTAEPQAVRRRARVTPIAFGVHLAALCLSPWWIERASAQEATLPGRPDEANTAPILSEVIVTATKRETKLQETPIAATVFTATQLENERLYNFADIAERTPGLDFIPYSR